MARRDIIAIGGSAGSIEAVKRLVGGLPPDLPAAIFVIIHLSARNRNFVPEILQRETRMPVAAATEGAPIRNGAIYVAPPDRHLIISQQHIHLTRGPKEGLQRPSINVSFRSAAAAYGERVIGILLSGMLDDGAAGIWEIARRGGVTIVQDPAEAAFPSMPLNALNDAIVHHTLQVAAIAQRLASLVTQEIPSTPLSRSAERRMDHFSGFTCPECRGPLYENGNPTEFRCRVGHTLSLRTLFEEHTSTQERKLYEAIVALDEGADLAERMALSGAAADQDGMRQEATQLRSASAQIRKLIEDLTRPPGD